MRARIEIPKGWRRVTRGNIKKGDCALCFADEAGTKFSWKPAHRHDIGEELAYFKPIFVIRRVKAAKGVRT